MANRLVGAAGGVHGTLRHRRLRTRVRLVIDETGHDPTTQRSDREEYLSVPVEMLQADSSMTCGSKGRLAVSPGVWSDY